jgi:hypothetical protein
VASQSRALYDITYSGLLCGRGLAAGYTVYQCPTVTGQIGRGQRDLWEGAPQNGALSAGVAVEQCAYVRSRISYTPMTGQEMLELFKSVGGQLPPQLQAAAQLARFINRSFLLGVQVRQSSPGLLGQMASTTDLMALAKGAIEEMALVWAPGKGASVMFLMDGADPAKLLALVAAMAPDMLGEIIPGLTQVLPGLIPSPNDPFWSVIFGSGGKVLPRQLAGLGSAGLGQAAIPQPGTPPSTGVDVVDTPGAQLPGDSPPIGELKVAGATVTTWLFGAAAAVLVTALIVKLASGR